LKKLLFLFLIILISCSKEEETRIFTVTTNAIPSEGGTVTLETTELTTGEYEWGDIAHVKAKPSDGYIFSSWSGNTRTGGNQDGTPGENHIEKYTSIDMRCYDSSNCTFDIIINAHFIKK
jgi:hypothetical protein